MRKTLLLCLAVCMCYLSIHGQAIYVDSNIGDDRNPGTKESPLFSMQGAVETIRSKNNNFYVAKINPGIYVLEHPVSVSTEKEMSGRRVVFEASVLPDDSAWTPEKMPVIVSESKKGEIPGEYYHYVVGLLINESHVTVRGMRFFGYFYPNARYFPIARFNKGKTDLLVEQCMFVGNEQASHIQVGIIAHGNEIKVDHCVFYGAKNAIVFYEESGNSSKTGNSFTNCIVYGAFSATWTSWPDSNFAFKNNVVTNCQYVFIKNYFNTTKYSMEDCAFVNNQNLKGVWHDEGVRPEEFETEEKNVTKEGKVSLRLMDEIDKPLPIDFLHVIPGSTGYGIGSGLFEHRKQ